MNANHPHESQTGFPWLWISSGILFLAILFARVVFPEYTWLTLAIAVALLASLAALVSQNQKALKSRSAAYGLNSAITVILVFGILTVANFMASRYPAKLDLTKNKVHTLSEQTIKLVKGLQKPVKATFYSKLQEREQYRSVLQNYKDLNPKFELEFVDPDREPTRAKQAGIKKYGTLQLGVGAREDLVTEINEEKVTNALMKLLKEKTPTLCVVTGHGEKNFNGAEAEGYQVSRQSLVNQAYQVKDFNLIQDAKDGRVPESCDALAIIGPSKAFFEPELKTLKDYLANGGRAVFALDLDIKGNQTADLSSVLSDWYVKPVSGLIVDPFSQMMGGDAAVPIVASYSKESPITKDFQMGSYFPFARPIEIVTGAPSGLTARWLAQTTEKSWAVTDLKSLGKGAVRFQKGRDLTGPLNAAVTVEGKVKDSKASKNTRLVVFGSSNFATNQFSRHGGNLDLFLNSVSWTLEDESGMAPIHAKEEDPGKLDMSIKMANAIGLTTVAFIPLMISAGGVGIWVYRRRL